MTKTKLKLKSSTSKGKKNGKPVSSMKLQKPSSTPDITCGFSPNNKFHLVSECRGEVVVRSYETLPALQAEARKLVASAAQSHDALQLRIFQGTRCPVSAGPVPRVHIDGQWIPLIEEFACDVKDCPVDGLVVGDTQPVDEEDIDHLDTDKVPDEDSDSDDEPAVVTGESEDSAKVLQIFNQEK